MCFGSKIDNDDPLWWEYIDDGQGWTARPRAVYRKTPEYNKSLQRQLLEERKTKKAQAAEKKRRS